jgi:hypothetical protein
MLGLIGKNILKRLSTVAARPSGLAAGNLPIARLNHV